MTFLSDLYYDTKRVYQATIRRISGHPIRLGLLFIIGVAILFIFFMINFPIQINVEQTSQELAIATSKISQEYLREDQNQTITARLLNDPTIDQQGWALVKQMMLLMLVLWFFFNVYFFTFLKLLSYPITAWRFLQHAILWLFIFLVCRVGLLLFDLLTLGRVDPYMDSIYLLFHIVFVTLFVLSTVNNGGIFRGIWTSCRLLWRRVCVIFACLFPLIVFLPIPPFSWIARGLFSSDPTLYHIFSTVVSLIIVFIILTWVFIAVLEIGLSGRTNPDETKSSTSKKRRTTSI